jgi:hypothetical protein
MERETPPLKNDLRVLERKVWSRFFRDGLFEMFFGMMFVSMGLRELADNIMFTLLIFVGILVMILGKRSITTPRMGIVKFGKERMKRRRWVLYVILAANIATGMLLMTTLFSGYRPGPEVTAPVIGGAILFIFLLIAYLLDHWKMALYGSVLACGIILMEAGEKIAGSIFLIISGSLLLAYGGYLLITFIQDNPLKEEC